MLVVALPPWQRAALFWSVCIPLRYYLSTLGNNRLLRTFALVTSYRWLSGIENTTEGQFGGLAWWKEERQIHGLLWGAYAATGNALMLKVDTLIGALNWVSELKPLRAPRLSQ